MDNSGEKIAKRIRFENKMAAETWGEEEVKAQLEAAWEELSYSAAGVLCGLVLIWSKLGNQRAGVATTVTQVQIG